MNFIVGELNCSEQEFSEKVKKVWKDIVEDDPFISAAQESPEGFVLGGQPGAGKTTLTNMLSARLNKNIISISGDDFRPYHPHFEEIQSLYKEESPKYTSKFSGRMTEDLIDKAVSEKYNIVVEGTFRTSATPVSTLKKMKQAGYRTGIAIQICDKETSWKSCQERYEKMKETNPVLARAVDKAHHDLVIRQLPETIKSVYESGFADSLEIYERFPKDGTFAVRKIFSSEDGKPLDVKMIEDVLEGRADYNKMP